MLKDEIIVFTFRYIDMTFEDDRYLVLMERNKMSIFLLLCFMLNMLLKLN